MLFRGVHRCVLWFGVLLGALPCTKAQPTVYEHVRFEHITGSAATFSRPNVTAHLQDNSVNVIHQDRYGFLWFGTNRGLARYDGYRFNLYGIDYNSALDHGHRIIRALTEDTEGHLWIGTEREALKKLDRRTRNLITYASSEIASPTVQIVQDGQGDLWFRTEQGHLFHVIPQRTKPIEKTNPGHPVNFLYIDPVGTLWMGTQGGGLMLRNPETASFETPLPPARLDAPSSEVHALSGTEDGNLWLCASTATPEGFSYRVSRYHPATDSLTPWPPLPRTQTDGQPGCTLKRDHRRTLWAGAWGLHQVDPLTPRYTSYYPDTTQTGRIKTITDDQRDALWLNTEAGLIQWDRNTKVFTPHRHDPENPGSISFGMIREVFADRFGVIWIGTFQGGLTKLDQNAWNFRHFRPSRSITLGEGRYFINGFAEDQDGILWIASGDNMQRIGGGGLERFDPLIGSFTHFRPNGTRSLASSFASSVWVDSRGNVWTGTYNRGLERFTPQTSRYQHYPTLCNGLSDLPGSFVQTLFEDHTRERLWVGCGNPGGLVLLIPETGEQVRFLPVSADTLSPFNAPKKSVSGDYIYAIQETDDGILWIGTNGYGLNRYDTHKKQFKWYLKNTAVTALHPAHLDQTLWVGTYTRGLLLFDTQNGEVLKTYHDALMYNPVQGILVDEISGLVWISTQNAGLASLDPHTESIRFYNHRAGLQPSYRIAAFKNSRGVLFFGGLNGFNTLWPALRRNHTRRPEVQLTGFRLTHQAPPPQSTGLPPFLQPDTVLAWNQNAFTFDFSTLDFSQMDHQQYRYQLAGYDDGWSEWSDMPTASYTQVPGGTYTFNVQARHASGEPGTESTFGLTIKTRLHQRAGFWLLLLGALFCLLWWYWQPIKTRWQNSKLRELLRLSQLYRADKSIPSTPTLFEEAETVLRALTYLKATPDLKMSNAVLRLAEALKITRKTLNRRFKEETEKLNITSIPDGDQIFNIICRNLLLEKIPCTPPI